MMIGIGIGTSFPRYTFSGGGPPPLPNGLTNRWSTSSLIGDDGDQISLINDDVGGNNGSASLAAMATLRTGSNGLNGYPILRFNGVANSFTLGSTIPTDGGFTLVSVMRRVGSNMISLGAGAADFYPSTNRTSGVIWAGNDRGPSGGGYSSASIADPGWIIMAVACGSGPSISGRQNGDVLTFDATTSYGANNPFSAIGQSINYADGYLADILLFSGIVLTDDEMAQAITNLNSKWGVF